MKRDTKHDTLTGVRPMATAHDLAHSIAEDGIGPHERTLLWMAKAAARDGVSPTLLAAMLDQTAAEVLRQRAFGAVMRAMENPIRRTDVASEVPFLRGEQAAEAS